jgi:hypothetical protein
MANNNRKGIDVSWGSGDTTLWINPVNGGFELLDYEFDTARIHEICSGRCYYTSRSGASGAGYIYHTGNLTKVGYYRVDTVNPWIVHESVAGIEILFPYASHQANKQELLEKYPVVLLVGENTIVYTNWYTTFNDTLRTLLSGKEVEIKTLTRSFVRTNGYYGVGQKEEVSIRFANLFGYCKMYPWQWARELLRNYQVGYPSERPWGIFHVSKLEDGRFVRTTKIGESLYATELLEQDPCEQVEETPKGWEIGAPNMVYRVREDEVYMMGWEAAKTLYEKRVERISRFVPTEERDAFLTHVRENLQYGKYVEYEVTVPKLLFFLAKDEQVAEIRHGIARKVRDDVMYVTRQFLESFNDRELLKTIPDDLVVTQEDSWASGNCHPGTQEFIDRFFPGCTQATAGELKKHADNWNVMRVLRYIAKREGIGGKACELPEE